MIYRLDKDKNRIFPCEEADFKTHNIFERRHIEKWVENYPELLGEPLLVVATEYDKFDKTSERLDILAIDKDGNLVVIELKRDDSGRNVDLQAIKYAAYCSTMRLSNLAELYKTRLERTGTTISVENAREKLLEFIENDEFEELSEKPRVILVSRQFRPEITASVLWLRKFGMDISCVRLSPYDIGGGEIAFEANILIPLPEARDFVIEVERKDAGSLTVSQVAYIKFYKELVERLKSEVPREYPPPQPRAYYQIPTGIGSVHFEWAFHGRPRSSFCVELHFEKGSREANSEILEPLGKVLPALEKSLGEKLVVQKDWGSAWQRIYVEKPEGQFTEELKGWAVEKMAVLIKGLQPWLETD